MKQVGYYNGTIADLNELKVPATDRALYFGDGSTMQLHLRTMLHLP